MQVQRASLLRRPMRPVSIIQKVTEDTQLTEDTTLPPTTGLPSNPQPPNAYFTRAFESLWSSLVTYSASFLLDEGIKRAKISRGFWVVNFRSVDELIETWQAGAPMEMDYIGGGYEVAKYYSGGDEEFADTVESYDLDTSICFIMVVDLITSIAFSWGTIDKYAVGNFSQDLAKS